MKPDEIPAGVVEAAQQADLKGRPGDWQRVLPAKSPTPQGSEPEPPDMDITDWPIYISDLYHVECHQPGCPDDGELPHPGRRVTVAEFLDAVAEHARTVHGLTIERTWGFR